MCSHSGMSLSAISTFVRASMICLVHLSMSSLFFIISSAALIVMVLMGWESAIFAMLQIMSGCAIMADRFSPARAHAC